MKSRISFRKLLLITIVSSLMMVSALASPSFNEGRVYGQGASIQNLSSQQQQYQAASDTIKEFRVPTNNSGPLSIIAAQNGTFWFTEFSAGKIGEFFAGNGTFREFAVPESGSLPDALAIDHNGKIWFSDQFGWGSVWMFDPSTSSFTQYKTLTEKSDPLFILIDSRNDVWFTEITGDKIGELVYSSYTMKEFQVPTSQAGPAEMTFAMSNGTSSSSTTSATLNYDRIWFTENYVGKVGSFDLANDSFKEYSPTVSLKSPVGIVSDSSGNLWMSEHGGSSIVEFRPSNSTWRKYPTSVPSPSIGYPISAPATLTMDAKGRLWFVEHYLNKVGMLDPSTNTIQEFVIPTPGAYSVQNAIDSQGNFWFTEFSANVIGVINSSASTSVSVEYSAKSTPVLASGHSVNATVDVTNEFSVPLQIQLSATSSFTQTGQTTSQQVSVPTSVFTLDPGKSKSIPVEITPDQNLATGTYSIGIIASAGNESTIGIIFLQVQGPFSISEILTNQFSLEIIVTLLVAAMAIYLVFLRRRGDKFKSGRRKTTDDFATTTKPKTESPFSATNHMRSVVGLSLRIIPITIAVIIMVTLVFPVTFINWWTESIIRAVEAKCPGLPGGSSSSGPDYINIALDVGLIIVAGFLAYLIVNDYRRKARRTSTGSESP